MRRPGESDPPRCWAPEVSPRYSARRFRRTAVSVEQKAELPRAREPRSPRFGTSFDSVFKEPEPRSGVFDPWFELARPWVGPLKPRSAFAGRGPEASQHGSRSSDRGWESSDHGLRSSNHGSESSNHGLRLSDHGRTSQTTVRTCQTPIRNPQTTVRAAQTAVGLVPLETPAWTSRRPLPYDLDVYGLQGSAVHGNTLLAREHRLSPGS